MRIPRIPQVYKTQYPVLLPPVFSSIPAYRLVIAAFVMLFLLVIAAFYLLEEYSQLFFTLLEYCYIMSMIGYILLEIKFRGHKSSEIAASSLTLDRTPWYVSLLFIPILSLSLSIDMLLDFVDIESCNLSLLGCYEDEPEDFLLNASRILNIFLVCFLVPIVEEVYFRGFLLSRLLRKFSAPDSIFIVSALFSVFHQDVAGAFLFSVVLCLIVQKTGSLSAPILIHIGHNSFVTVWDMFPIYFPESTPAIVEFVIMLAVSFIGFYLGRDYVLPPKKTKSDSRDRTPRI